MSMLSDAERRFVRRRTRLARAWVWVGSLLLAGWFALFGWLWLARRTLIDPQAVWTALADGSMADSSWRLLAAMAPVLFWLVFALVVALILILFGYNVQERRLLALLHRLDKAPSAPPT